MRVIKQIRRELSVIRVLLEELVDQGRATKYEYRVSDPDRLGAQLGETARVALLCKRLRGL